jgi:gamma-glutamylcysteine synthetase
MHYFKFFTKLQITKFTNNENLKFINFAAWKSKKDIRSLQKELRDFCYHNDKAFRGNQVYEWLGAKVHSLRT